MLLKNKNAVITGCNKGIGREVLKTFSKNGANVFACVRSIDESFKKLCQDLEENNKTKIVPISLDLEDESGIPSISLLTSILSIGLLAIFRRK